MLLPILLIAVSLDNEMSRIAAEARGRVGSCAMVVETGKRSSFNGSERFPMQSVYKLPIGMAVLNDVDHGRLTLDQTLHVSKSDLLGRGQHSPLRDDHPQGDVDVPVRELLRLMVAESDGTASDVLLRGVGGAVRVTQYLRGLGIHGVQVVTTEMDMGRDTKAQYRNWATPDSAVDLLRVLQEGKGLSAASRTLLMDLLAQSTPGKHRIKGRLPKGTVVAHKTGTSQTSHDGVTYATNDIGLITLPDGRHLAIAVFVSDSKASDDVREGVIARIARAAWDANVK